MKGSPSLDADRLLRLEHLIIAHQRLPEWGSPKPPMTPEALLVHFADDIDAKYAMMVNVFRDDTNPGPVTSKKNVLDAARVQGGKEKGEGRGTKHCSNTRRLTAAGDGVGYDQRKECRPETQRIVRACRP